MLSGVDLIRRVTGDAVHALCWPLLTAADGTKLGKTTGARVWLDAGLTSPYAFFQHWMQVDDADVGPHLAQFTLLPMAEVDAVVAEHRAAPARRVGQRRLATEVTTLVHGTEEAEVAAEAASILFGSDPRDASPAALQTVAAEVPGTRLEPGEDLGAGVDLVPLLVRTGLAGSLSEARRQLAQGGVSVNGDKAAQDRRLTASDALHGRWVLLRRGKRDWAVVQVGD
jgi:tyrosyl-tRNA synthetase